jgi:DNA-binding Lrp family transcriptional regulator
MDTSGAPTVAAELGVSLPRLHRSIRSIRPERGTPVRLSAEEVAVLKRRLGSIPRITGFSREELQVLVALSRHPRGLISIRQVAKAAGISPTTASKILKGLEGRDLVKRETARLFEASVQDRPVYVINFGSPEWPELARRLARATLPELEEKPPGRRLPPRLAATFWTGSWHDVDVTANPLYVARRILAEGPFDPEAVSFLGELPRETVGHAVSELIAAAEPS